MVRAAKPWRSLWSVFSICPCNPERSRLTVLWRLRFSLLWLQPLECFVGLPLSFVAGIPAKVSFSHVAMIVNATCFQAGGVISCAGTKQSDCTIGVQWKAKQLGVALFAYFAVRFDELRGDLRDNRITRSAQCAHMIGYPWSQRENFGFRTNAPLLAVSAFDGD